MNSSGKVALITGAGSPQGIGFATARLLAQQGLRIAITSTTGRIEERACELAAEGADVFAFPTDLRDRAAWGAMGTGINPMLVPEFALCLKNTLKSFR